MRRSVLALLVLVLSFGLAPTALAVPPGTFSRMFPTLPAFTTPTDQQISDLAGTMKGDLVNPDNTAISAGFTFFGQFLDHDMTLDTEPLPTDPVNIKTLDNDRNGNFDLDSVYGAGPQGTPQLYQADGKHLRVGVSIAVDGQEIPDLPRDSNGLAFLGDGRNDENLIIAQLHAGFLRFHNRLIDDGKSFADAQRLTRWHYQWIIVHQYLPLVVGQANVDRYLNGDAEFYKPDNPLDPVLPIEFSVAAFRFGHSQVRPAYRLNGTTNGARPIFDSSGVDLRGGQAVPAALGIEWKRFFDIEGSGVVPTRGKQIDTRISPPLFNLPNTVVADGKNVLAFRNMVRGKFYGLASGQDVASAMGERAIKRAELADYLSKRADPVSIPAGFEKGMPLWYYILAESEMRQGGLRLGPVGARIVAQVFLTNLKRDPGSYLNANPAFQPSAPQMQGSEFTMDDFLQYAGVVKTYNNPS